MAERLPTVTIMRNGRRIRINERDYDPQTHRLADGPSEPIVPVAADLAGSPAHAFLDEADNLSGIAEFHDWRNRIVESGVIGDDVPRSKDEIVAELERAR